MNTFKGQALFYIPVIQVGQSSIPASDLDVIIPGGNGHIVACTRMGLNGGMAGFCVRVATAAVKGTGTFKGTLGIESNGVELSPRRVICDFSVTPNINRAVNSRVAIGNVSVSRVPIFAPELITIMYRETGSLGTGSRPQFQLVGALQWKHPEANNEFVD